MTQLTINVPDKLARRLSAEAKHLGISEEARIARLLETYVTPWELQRPQLIERGLPVLVSFLSRVPATRVISSSPLSEANWWVKIEIDISSPLAWQVVQELGFVLNYISLQERLPTVFMPVSPPPYLNEGGPDGLLSWVIEAAFPFVDPLSIHAELENRLPNPVDDPEQWGSRDEPEE